MSVGRMVSILWFVCLFPVLVPVLRADTYNVGWYDAGIIAGGGLLSGVGFHLEEDLNPPDDSVIEELAGKRDSVNPFDRVATYEWSEGAQSGSDVILYGSFILPFTLLASKRVADEWDSVLVLYLEAFSLSFGMNKITKVVARRYRPYMYNDDPSIPLDMKRSVDARESFYSGHTAITFTFTVLTAKLFSDFDIAPSYDGWVWGGAALIGSAVGLLRVLGGMHFPSDVITGALMGSLVGFYVPELHRGEKGKKKVELNASFDRILIRYEF